MNRQAKVLLLPAWLSVSVALPLYLPLLLSPSLFPTQHLSLSCSLLIPSSCWQCILLGTLCQCYAHQRRQWHSAEAWQGAHRKRRRTRESESERIRMRRSRGEELMERLEDWKCQLQRQRPRYLTRKLLTMLTMLLPLFSLLCVCVHVCACVCVRACACEHILVCIAAAAVVNNKFPLELQQICSKRNRQPQAMEWRR